MKIGFKKGASRVMLSIFLGLGLSNNLNATASEPSQNLERRISQESTASVRVNTAYDIPYLKIDVVGIDTKDEKLEKIRRTRLGTMNFWTSLSDSPYYERLNDN